MTKREEYLAAKEKVSRLQQSIDKISNTYWGLQTEAKKLCEPLWQAYQKGLEEAQSKVKERFADQLKIKYDLEDQLVDARHIFNRMHYQCNHLDENGILSIVETPVFGADPDDKCPLKCTICGETWK